MCFLNKNNEWKKIRMKRIVTNAFFESLLYDGTRHRVSHLNYYYRWAFIHNIIYFCFLDIFDQNIHEIRESKYMYTVQSRIRRAEFKFRSMIMLRGRHLVLLFIDFVFHLSSNQLHIFYSYHGIVHYCNINNNMQ